MADQEHATATATETPDGGAEQGSQQTTEQGAGENGSTQISQSELDRVVSKALETARAKWERDHEQERKAAEEAARKAQLEQEGKYEELLNENRAELAALKAEQEARDYRINARELLDELGLGDFASVIIPNGVEPIETTRERAEQLKSKLDTQTQAAVEARLNTGKAIPNNTKPAAPKKLTDMTTEEYSVWRKERGYY